MSETTFEMASRCPKCTFPSKIVLVKPVAGGGKVHTFECENERCEDTGGRRLVQTNPDGSIPQEVKGPKAFPHLQHSTGQAQRARDDLAVMDYMSTHPGVTWKEAYKALGG